MNTLAAHRELRRDRERMQYLPEARAAYVAEALRDREWLHEAANSMGVWTHLLDWVAAVAADDESRQQCATTAVRAALRDFAEFDARIDAHGKVAAKADALAEGMEA